MLSGLKLKIASKYPWSKIAAEFVIKSDINLKELSGNTPEVKYAIERLKLVVNSTTSLNENLVKNLNDSPYAPYSFPLCNIILSLINEKILQMRWGVFESKITQFNLEGENHNLIEKLANENFKWNILILNDKDKKEALKKTGMNYDFKIEFDNFLTANTSFQDLKWKLSNQILSLGYVFLTKPILIRLISENVKNQLNSKDFIPIKVNELKDDFLVAINEVKNQWEIMKKNIGIESAVLKGPIAKEAFPPCISNILSNLLNGINISHHGRFTLTSFLLNIGMKEEEILDIFRTSPDFDEKKAIYQIKHIKGSTIDKPKYSPPSCKTLKTYGLCVNMNQFCERIKHPISYYEFKRRKYRTQVKENKS